MAKTVANSSKRLETKVDTLLNRLDLLDRKLTGFFKQIFDKETQVDKDLQAIIDQAQKNTDAEAAATAALDALFGQLVIALQGTGPISAEDRAVLQAKVQSMQDSAAAVAAAIVKDTPAAPAPPASKPHHKA